MLKDNSAIEKIRREYSLMKLDETNVEKNPFSQFRKWLDDAVTSEIVDTTAFALGTSDKKGKPSQRIVLLKGIDKEGLIFYTNYESKKASDIFENPYVSALFYWREIERQVRVTGRVKKISAAESEKYFTTRPFESKISAWVSKQSSVVESRDFLDQKFTEYKKKFADGRVPLPKFWGGFKIIPDYFEFWQGRESRLHDRVCFEKNKREWKIFRLAP